MLVRYPKRESHQTSSITRALLLSMELYLYVDDDGSWHRPARNGGGVLTKEDALSAIVLHCTGFRVGGNALRMAANKTYGKLVGGNTKVKRLSWAKNIRKNVPQLRAFLQEEPAFGDVLLQRDPVAVQLAQQAYSIQMQLDLLAQLRQDHSAMQQLCEELGGQVQEGNEQSKQLRKELKIARKECSDATAALDQFGTEAGGLDISQLLIDLNKTEAELAKFKKYSGNGMLLKQNQQLQEHVAAGAAENAALHDLLIAQDSVSAQLQSELLSSQTKVHTLRMRKHKKQTTIQDKEAQIKDLHTEVKRLSTALDAAADYCSQTTATVAKQIKVTEDMQAVTGALWQSVQKDLSKKDAQLAQMSTELEGLQTFQTWRGGKYTTEINILFYDALQRGLSPRQARPMISSMLKRMKKKFKRLPSLSKIKNMPQV